MGYEPGIRGVATSLQLRRDLTGLPETFIAARYRQHSRAVLRGDRAVRGVGCFHQERFNERGFAGDVLSRWHLNVSAGSNACRGLDAKEVVPLDGELARAPVLSAIHSASVTEAETSDLRAVS
jgi:hypothetical protein